MERNIFTSMFKIDIPFKEYNLPKSGFKVHILEYILGIDDDDMKKFMYKGAEVSTEGGIDFNVERALSSENRTIASYVKCVIDSEGKEYKGDVNVILALPKPDIDFIKTSDCIDSKWFY